MSSSTTVRCSLLALAFAASLVAHGACAAAPATTPARTVPEPELRRFLAELAPAPEGELSFVETRMSALLSAPLELRGVLRIEPDGSIDKQLLEPLRERVRISRSALTIEREGRTQTLALGSNRQWTAFHAGISGLVRRDPAALLRVFSAALERDGENWRLRLEPKARAGRGGAPTVFAIGRGARLVALRLEQGRDEWQEMRFEPAASAPAAARP